MAMTAAQWNRLQQSLPTEDRMTYAEYLAAIGETPVAETATTTKPTVTEVAANLTKVVEAASNAADATTSTKEAASFKAIEDAANAEYAKTIADAKAAELAASGSGTNTDITKGKLTGVRPVLGAGDASGKVGGTVEFFEYKPFDEAARRAIFGYNPKTGKSYTDEESAAANGGWNPWAGAKGYEIDPRTGNLNVLMENGSVMTTGAKYQMSSAGFVIPQESSLPPGHASDEFGRYYAPGEIMPNESLAAYVRRMSQIGPGILGYKGKFYQYNARGMFYENGTQEPVDFVDTQENAANTMYIQSSNANAATRVNTASNLASGTLTNAAGLSTGTSLKLPAGVTVTTTYNDPTTGDTIGVLSNGTTQVLTKGTTQETTRQSIIATLTDRFSKYGLGSLAGKIRELAVAGATDATITLQLQETPEYQQRFAANADRIKKGLAVLTPAEYINVEDSYRQVLRAYGLKQFDNDAYVKQFIANDMSPTELSNRVVTAVQRVQNADPAIANQLRQYYGIGATDMVAYVLDPEQQFQKIERQVAASEIGVAAARQGLSAGVSVAEQLAAQGVSQAEAQKGYATIADILPTAEKLSSIYGKTLDTYDQSQAEQEVFNQLASAQRKRQKLSATEIAQFSGSSGLSKASLTDQTKGQF